MNDHVSTISPDLRSYAVLEEMRSAFAEKVGRPLTQSEREFVEQMLGESSIFAHSWAWTERFEDTVITSEGIVGDAGGFLSRWGKAFGAGYQEMFSPDEALSDIVTMEDLGADDRICVRAYRRGDDPSSRFRFKLYHRAQAAPLAEVLQILEHLGLKALVEEGFPVHPSSGEVIWVHEFLVDDPRGEDLVFSDVARTFEAAFVAIWTGETENDGFNRLVLELGASWREAAIFRALARYRQQSGLDPSQRTQIRVLLDHRGLTRLLLELFKVKFDPETGESIDERRSSADDVSSLIEEQLQAVASLEDDRVLRRLYRLVHAVKRTNFYQVTSSGRPKRWLALKIASRELDDLPEPRPFREIFVSAPHVEGVHLRFGAIARGGIRWSDRHDDFRAEVLGLVKAQQVKNAVIVPVGAKGGFVVKGPRAGDSAGVRGAALAAYRDFLSGLLDVTDNLGSEGQVIQPELTVIHEGDDPYLVVAADKGTASFSDAANEVSAAYGFWLGDAFASGGSTGYDHKAMGITARGAWEAVSRHFRELGKNIAVENFTAVGVGDMSGDVFGNGMLLSTRTRLVAAFDHRDIFIDPAPDPTVSWTERKRLFELPRSSWQDYDRSKLSRGGGIFSRELKSIDLSEESRRVLGIGEAPLTPAELIRAILKAPVELLYMGGIGTYVKSVGETDLQVADKANDAVRVNGGELRAAVVGEGANLGFTQAGRIEFARTGGRINTDAIDNSAGVDSSDLEVNIKILTSALERQGSMTRQERDALVASMTDDVAKRVLAHNRSQTLALSLMMAEAPRRISEHAAFVDALEKAGRLDRTVEGLPSPRGFEERRERGEGLSRPELAVLLAYGKLSFFDGLMQSPALDDPYFIDTLEAYFPEPLKAFGPAIRQHPLRRKVIATVLANEIVDVTGIAFPARILGSEGGDAGTIATAFAAAAEIFGLDELWQAVHALDGAVGTDCQHRLYAALARAFRQQVYTILRKGGAAGRTVGELVGAYRDPARELIGAGARLLGPAGESDFEERVATAVGDGVPTDLAEAVAIRADMGPTLAIADIAADTGRSLIDVGFLYHAVSHALGFGRIVEAADRIAAVDQFGSAARRTVISALFDDLEGITRLILNEEMSAASADVVFRRWSERHGKRIAAALAGVEEIDSAAGPWTLAKLIVAQSSLGRLAGSFARSGKSVPA
jgi:glutamate dehydrogenase